MPKLVLNGKRVNFEPGMTILEAARAKGVDIPTLCHLPQVEATGVCRICVVEVEGSDRLLPACKTPASEGMKIRTDSPRVMESRRTIIRMLVDSGDHNCLYCPGNGDCTLQNLAYSYGIRDGVINPSRPEGCPVDETSPVINRDYGKCVLCGRCVQACNQVQVNQAIPEPFGRREDLGEGWYPLVDHEACTHCGECVQACPTGALTDRKAQGLGRPWETDKIRTTCPYCGVGCQQLLHVKDGRIVKVTGVEEAEPNHGRLCVKGRFGYDFIHSGERLTTPLIQDGDGFREASWDEALNLVAKRFTEIRDKYGPDALAGISSARSINEDSYNMQKLFRAVIGTNNIDHCARTCHAPTVAGLARSFGSGAMTNSFADFPKAKMFFVIGSNMTEAHPVAATYVKQAVLNGARLIVADPRFNGIARHAHTYLPIKVGSDVAFLNSIMQVLITEDLHDKGYVKNCTVGFEELKSMVMKYPPEKAADIVGIPAQAIRGLARELASVKPLMLVYTLGITEHTCGVNNVMSTANLQMLLGNVGFECGGVNPLRGQNNVQGACDMGALPGDYPGYQKVADPKARAKFEKAWGAKLPDRPGLMIPEMITGLKDGNIKALYVFGENIANTEPDIHHVESCLEAAEFLVVNDIFLNETTRFAHVVLPGAAWSEDDGTFTNSERRVNRVRKAVPAPGQAKPDWWIFKEIARRMGQTWKSNSGKDIWDKEVAALCPMFAGIKYKRIEHDGLQWPVPDGKHPGTRFLHKEGCFTCGLGNLIPVEWTPPAEVPDGDYPYVLSTGRRLYHYHTRTQTGRCGGLNELLGEETADISPADAKGLGVADGEMVKVRSRRGQVVVRARVTDQVPPGLVWMAFHFREGNANWLTNTAMDPVSHTAEFKACAVALEKV